jgi:hypothetical protein
VRQLLEDTGLDVGSARTLDEAAAISPAPPPIVLLGPHLADGDAAPLLARWSADPAFRDATVVLMGPWPTGSARAGPGCHIEILRGQRASDAAGRVRALIAERRRPRRSAKDG